jgi:hypothetical protein
MMITTSITNPDPEEFITNPDPEELFLLLYFNLPRNTNAV